MDRFKIVKIYLLFFLVIIFSLTANLEEFVTFFMSTKEFNSAITIMFLIGLSVLLTTTAKLVILRGNLEQLKSDKKMKEEDFFLLNNFLPENLIKILKRKKEKEIIEYTSGEKEIFLDTIFNKFATSKQYVMFTVESSLMLGLLGTFLGLLIAISEMGKIVDLLVNMDKMDMKVVLSSFGGPLKGMATGFGSSLFGVIVSILLNTLMYIFDKSSKEYIVELEDYLQLNAGEEIVEQRLATQAKNTKSIATNISGIYHMINKVIKNSNEK